MNVTKSNSIARAFFVLFSSLFISSSFAAAGVVTLTGGDAGEGLTINPSAVVYAVDFYSQQGSQSVQGVSFQADTYTSTNGPFSAYSGKVIDTVSSAPGGGGQGAANGGGGNSPAANFPVVTQNDTNLLNILQSIPYGQQHIDISGLNPNGVYSLQLLTSDGTYNERIIDVAINGVTTNTGVDITTSTGLNIVNTFVADNHGDATIDLTPNASSGDKNPTLAGLVITSVPEPSSIILCGLGAVGLFVAARRRRGA